MIHYLDLPPCARTSRVRRHHSVDIYKCWHRLFLSATFPPNSLPLDHLSLGVGLGDGHGLQVLPLGDFGLELFDDGGDVRDVLRL